jgi:hypothetical protein
LTSNLNSPVTTARLVSGHGENWLLLKPSVDMFLKYVYHRHGTLVSLILQDNDKPEFVAESVLTHRFPPRMKLLPNGTGVYLLGADFEGLRFGIRYAGRMVTCAFDSELFYDFFYPFAETRKVMDGFRTTVPDLSEYDVH